MTVVSRAALVVVLFAVAAAAAAETAPAGPRHSLKDLLARAAKVSPEVEAAYAGLAAAEARQGQARGALFPQITLTGVFGPSTEALGTVNFPLNTKSDAPVNGVFGRGDVTVLQPLFTFGRISSFRRAAAAGVQVESARVDEARANVALRIKELYFGKLLTADLLALADEILDGIDDASSRLKRRLQGGDSNADESDLYRLNTYRALAAEARSEVLKNRDNATAALRAFTGLPADDPVELDAPGLSVPPAPAEPEVESIARALRLRPEMRQARAGLEATAALARAERANLFPQLFLGVNGYFARATNRERQQNPFVYDSINDHAVAPLLGARYQLDFGITLGRIRELGADHARVVALERLGQIGVPLQVRVARRELTAAAEVIKSAEEGAQNARRWLVVAQSNYDVGIRDAVDLGDAVVNYARLRSDHLTAIYTYNVAIARVDHAIGRDAGDVAQGGER